MVVHNLNLLRIRAGPNKANTILVIYFNAVLSFSVPF